MRELYADVIVDISSRHLDRAFSYRVGEELRKEIEPGMVVEVPFGSGDRPTRGYVIRLSDETTVPMDKLKEISRLVTDGLGSETKLISLAAWMRARYSCTMSQALRTVIPVKQKTASKYSTLLHLHLSSEEAQTLLADFEKKQQKARARLLRALIDQPVLPQKLAAEKLRVTPDVIRYLKDRGVITLTQEKLWRYPQMPQSHHEQDKGHVQPSVAQRSVIERIIHGWEEETARAFLLHGITGSGKTIVYMELIAHALAQGEQVILMIPEIALTYQTLMRMYARFGAQVSVIHSQMSAGERYDQFELAKTGEVSVMIGPRSALFTPFSQLGLIIVDEEHDSAYQAETMPLYDAVEVARQRAKIEGACLVLGSATPSLRSYTDALKGKLTLLELTERVGSALLPTTRIVDMRREMKEGCRSILSRPLQESLRQVLADGQQAMLFLNRRGYAGFVSCRSCGEPIRCPHCDVSLSLHDNRRMVCHYCGYERPAVKICPTCGSPFIRTFRAGTQQVEEEVQRIFPTARVLRMDADSTRRKGSAAKLLSDFSDHKADILIGTQMIVKGHDFPEVTLMGILAADLSLNADSYLSGERTFQLITQAVGRAGRSDRLGQAMIQTYQPDHYAIRCAADQDYGTFYEQEISYRQIGMYPPTGAMSAIHLSAEDKTLLETAAYYLGQYARYCSQKAAAQVLGPTDETIAKIQDKYRKVIYLKAAEEKNLMLVREQLLSYIQINEGFRRIQIRFEVK